MAKDGGEAMTITFVGAGTSATANNASVTPVAHASTTAGDYVVVAVSSGGAAVTFATPTGWSRIAGAANHRVFGRIWQTGDSIPAFAPAGGVAGDDVIGQTFTFRGAEADALEAVGGADAGASQTNASAQNIAYPALAVPADRHAVVMSVAKRDDATSYTTPAGWTVAAALTSTTTGNDASQACYHQIQTTDTDITAGSVVVTGGAAAVSSALLFTIRPAAAIAIDEQDSWPPRVLISVTGLTLGDSVQLFRVVGSVRTAVRAGSDPAVTDSSFLRVDAELPFGVPVTYLALVNDAIEYTSATATYTLPGGKNALTDAVSGLAAEVVVQDWPARRRERDSSAFTVGGRNVVVSGFFAGFTGQVVLYTEAESSGDTLETLLTAATEGVVQLRQGSGAKRIDSYVTVPAYSEERYSQFDGTDERRLWTLDVVETDPWAVDLEAAGYTLADIAAYYDGLTLNDLANDFATLLALAQAEFPT